MEAGAEPGVELGVEPGAEGGAPENPEVIPDVSNRRVSFPPAPVASSSERGGDTGEECISVIARVRPDKAPSEFVALKERQVDVFVPRDIEVLNNHVEEYNFKFSKVIGPTATQEDVFNIVARDLVIGALDGVNCTIFAYGQTGSGKTFTICGGKESYSDRGIIPRTLATIFDAIDRRQDGVNYTVSMSFIEVYMEQGQDLLHKDVGKPGSGTGLPLVQVSIVGEEPVLQGAKRVPIASEDQGLEQYYLGDLHRTVAATPHNLNSSRSHCIFTIFIEASDPVNRTVRQSKIQIVDLAGSERLKPYEQGSQNKKKLMDQAVAINLSLHWLAHVINALNTPGRKGPVPYRNSFLTKVLKDALGGNARAAMVATINPSDPALPETIATCRFAQHVANVQTYSKINEELDPQLVIAALRQEKAELQAVIAAQGGEDEEISDADLRGRVRSYLEDDRSGTDGGAVLRLSGMRNAFAAFRVFREFFWDLLRGRGRGGSPTAERTPFAHVEGDTGSEAATATAAAAPPTADALRSPGHGARNTQSDPENPLPQGDGEELQRLRRALDERDGECRMLRAQAAHASTARTENKAAAAPQSGAQEEQLRRLRRTLEEREHECRMLRAAAAAQPPPPPPVRPPAPAKRKVITVSASTQTEAMPKKVKKKQDRQTSCDSRLKKIPNFIGFSQEDVVDRFGRDSDAPAKPFTFVVDPRVPDFRSMRPSDAKPEEAGTGESAATSKQPQGSSPHAAIASRALNTRSSRELTAVSSRELTAVPSSREVTFAASPREVSSASSCEITAAVGGAVEDTNASRSASAAAAAAPPVPAQSSQAPQAAPAGRSASWLSATTALTRDERALLGDESQAYQVFLQHDPRAAEIWPAELQKLRSQRRERMEEARNLGETIEHTKASTQKVQVAIETLKLKLREAEEEAAVDPAAEHRATTLRDLLSTEEPRLVTLFEEKRRQYEGDCQRLKEVRREVNHLEHGEKQMEALVRKEFLQWIEAARARYAEDTSVAGVPAQSPACADSSAGVSEHGSVADPGGSGQPVPAPAPAAKMNAQSLAAAESALAALRLRLEEARETGDEARQRMLEKILATEEPRLQGLRQAMDCG